MYVDDGIIGLGVAVTLFCRKIDRRTYWNMVPVYYEQLAAAQLSAQHARLQLQQPIGAVLRPAAYNFACVGKQVQLAHCLI